MLILLLLINLLPAISALVAFPGASGFGQNAQGGRRGTLYIVSTLADNGDGSLRDAVSQPNRIVVFSVGGVISIASRLVVSKNISILGQTAPGDGITVYGNGWSFSNADGAIVRYVRIRMGRGGSSGKDALTIAEGSNMIFDHVSVSWGRDETFSISGADVGNITVQNSIIAQGLETHSCGGLMQTKVGNGISLFRNLYIDNKTRNPKVKGSNDFTNNVVYNWGGGGAYIAGDSEDVSEVNVVGNYFIAGPSSSVPAFTRGNAQFHGFVESNVYDGNKDGALNGAALAVDSASYGGMAIQRSRFPFPGPPRVLSPADAVAFVTKYAGASLIRDSVDTQLVAEFASYGKKGGLISDEASVGGVGTVKGGSRGVDSDGDGMPDEAERRLGFNPTKADAMVVGPSGYTNVEVWANSLVIGE